MDNLHDTVREDLNHQLDSLVRNGFDRDSIETWKIASLNTAEKITKIVGMWLDSLQDTLISGEPK